MNGDNIRMAFRGLRANRMRTLLTMLGILIGVASVILMVAVGNGLSAMVQHQIETLGSNALYVHPLPEQAAHAKGGTLTRAAQLTRADVKAIATKAPAVAAAVPWVSTPITVTWQGASHTVTNFVGAGAGFDAVRNITLRAGRFYSDQDVADHAKVIVLGPTVEEMLAPDGAGLVGARVQVNGVPFHVIGVMERKGSSAFGDQDDVGAAPITAVEDALTGVTTSYSAIAVQAASRQATAAAEAEVSGILRANHRLAAGDPDDFEIFNQAQLLTTGKTAAKVFAILLGVVAAVSLVVGGIGVMNIMLVTVTERTREIGIRKALGAQRGDVVGQFMVESVIVSLLGGALGVTLALGASRMHFGPLKPIIEPLTIPLGFGVAAAVGVFFGAWPANRAASLAPVSALRHE